MRALTHSAYGPAAEVLAVQDVENPKPAAGEVLVRVRAAGIAKGNWLLTHGLPFIARPSYGLRRPNDPIAGLQFAGVVEKSNASDSDLAVGDEVFGQHPGAFAELVAVPATTLARKPAQVSFEQAAATPISGLAALQAVRTARVAAGQRVLVVGASGGVGSFTVQIAKARGAHVTGVASTRNLERLRALGADDAIDYKREAIDARGKPYDVVIDIAGNRSISTLRRVLTVDGTLVIVGGSGGPLTMGFGRTVGAMLLNRFVRHRILGLLSQPNPADLQELAALMAEGHLTPLVQPPVQLERAPEAIERVGRGEVAGSLVVAL